MKISQMPLYIADQICQKHEHPQYRSQPDDVCCTGKSWPAKSNLNARRIYWLNKITFHMIGRVVCSTYKSKGPFCDESDDLDRCQSRSKICLKFVDSSGSQRPAIVSCCSMCSANTFSLISQYDSLPIGWTMTFECEAGTCWWSWDSRLSTYIE